jgi:hypothetical protein
MLHLVGGEHHLFQNFKQALLIYLILLKNIVVVVSAVNLLKVKISICLLKLLFLCETVY